MVTRKVANVSALWHMQGSDVKCGAALTLLEAWDLIACSPLTMPQCSAMRVMKRSLPD